MPLSILHCSLHFVITIMITMIIDYGCVGVNFNNIGVIKPYHTQHLRKIIADCLSFELFGMGMAI